MLSIGLTEELSRSLQSSSLLCYLCCQNADDELNTANAIITNAIIKGLILSLITQQDSLIRHLRRRWDSVKGVLKKIRLKDRVGGLDQAATENLSCHSPCSDFTE
jgi:hypothetical protein